MSFFARSARDASSGGALFAATLSIISAARKNMRFAAGISPRAFASVAALYAASNISSSKAISLILNSALYARRFELAFELGDIRVERLVAAADLRLD